ncbi:hypothetical protein AB4099_29605 [Bosea sp. 2KB_26]|uniref:hypothetical protein n=1 Tax=Bosea sp. 2KB_26 TaxID=3237475 RepID=UPI003F9132E3
MAMFSSSGQRPELQPRVYSQVIPGYHDEHFDSAKTGGRFPVATFNEALLLKHLEADPRIVSYSRIDLSHLAEHSVPEELYDLPLLQFQHFSGRYAILICTSEQHLDTTTARALQSLEHQMASVGRWLLVREPDWLTRDPRRRTVETICDCRFEFISHGDRLSLLRELDRTGALDLCDCAEFVTSPRPVEAVLSLAVHGEIYLDVNAPLTLHSVIRPSGQ